MRRNSLIGICIGVGLFVSAETINLSNKTNRTSAGFAVLELFTSEGCSSCPPADDLVAKLQTEYKDKVYILAFHVDYWDRLGWKDVFSDAGFTQRQYQYADWLKLSSVYTPQVVVNGTKEFVGSNERALRAAIDEALQQSSTANLVINEVSDKSDKITVNYTATAVPPNTSLVFAWIEKQAKTKVLRGENSGRELSHVQIVRHIKTTDAKNGAGTLSFQTKETYPSANTELILLLQNKKTGAIIAAATK